MKRLSGGRFGGSHTGHRLLRQKHKSRFQWQQVTKDMFI